MKAFKLVVPLVMVLMVAGCVSVNSRRYADRLAALGKLETQEEYLECILTGLYDDIRAEAIPFISSDEGLMQIVLSKRPGVGRELKELAALRIAADRQRLRAIEDCADLGQKVRDEVARKVVAEDVCAQLIMGRLVSKAVVRELVEKVKNQNLLADIVRKEEMNEEIRIGVIRRLTRTEILRALALSHASSMKVRECSLDRLMSMNFDCTDVFLALENPILAARTVKGIEKKERPDVQKKLLEVFSALSDDNLLLGVFNALERTVVLDRVDDQKKVARLLMGHDSSEFRRKAKFLLLDAEVISWLVVSSEARNPGLAAWGLERVWGDLALTRVLRGLKTGYAITKAVSLVRDEARLKAIAADMHFSETVRIASIGRLSLASNDVLRKLVLTDSIVVARAARERLSILEEKSAADLMLQYEEARRVREKVAKDEDARRAKEFIERETLLLEMEEQVRNCRSWAQITKMYGLNDRQTFRFKGTLIEEVAVRSERAELIVEGKSGKVTVHVKLKTPVESAFPKGTLVVAVGDYEALEVDTITLRDTVLSLPDRMGEPER